MATDNMAGLFSTPEQYQQARIDQQRAQAIQMAQLDPFQQGQANIQMGMNRLADVGAGALGVQDPMLKLQSIRQQVLQGLDPNDAVSIAKAAQALAQAGDQQGAMQLGQRALEIRNTESQISGRTDEKQAQRALQLQMAQEKNQTAKDLAAERNAIMVQIAQMNSALRGANSDVQRQLIEQRIQDLQVKAEEKQATLQSQAQGKVAAFDSALDTLNVISNHPGKKSVVGALTGGVVSMIPGTDAAGFTSQLETFKAQTFIPQVAALKGMGALSDAEGKKLTAAVGALDPKMKQKEFDAQVVKIKASLEEAKQRALNMPGMPKQAQQPALGTVNNPIVLK
ncbi:hypothetical protein UFOVP176_6 [uncultured Caudovirales phage]|uniref:Uncharacterized protein n=1 Tax=uncultured Caudovirales phage TaxID=2100421 RepID=A0A6J7WHL0_9CAUD|nr:hypothetical protein UFOVP176_6 [uncultured Caudovirales phage]